MAQHRTLVAVALAALAAMPAAAQTATTSVINGATIEYKGVAVHLWGIDAPEKAQICADGWPAGLAAIDHLKSLVEGQSVGCVQKSADQSPRVTAVCKANGKDLSAEMASAGLAWALTSETLDYTVAETNAMAAVLGVHGHPCMKVWEWRNRQLKLPP